MGCGKLSVLRREYLLQAVNVLTSCLKILHSTNIDFFQLNIFRVFNKYGKARVVQIATVFVPVYHVVC